jgi:hypothetical protein
MFLADYKLQDSFLQPPVTSSPYVQVIFSSPSSQTLTASFHYREIPSFRPTQYNWQHHNSVCYYNLHVYAWESVRGRILDRTVVTLCEFNELLNCSWIRFWFAGVDLYVKDTSNGKICSWVIAELRSYTGMTMNFGRCQPLQLSLENRD